jgi:VanZ family protein
MFLIKKYPFAPGILFFLISLLLLTLPGDTMPSVGWFNFPHRDKFIHYCLFFMLCSLLAIPVKYRTSSKQAGIVWLAIVCVMVIGYGIAIEFVQKWWIPNRGFEVLDIVADATGAVAAFGYCYMRFIKNR